MTLRVEVSGEKFVNIESYKCKPYEGENNKSDQKINSRIKDFIKKTWALRSKVTVEPYVICYVLPSVLAGLAVQNLCLEKSCLVNLKYDQNTCRHIMDGRTFNYTEQEKNVQKMVASMTAWSFPLQTALPGILTLFVGSWSDRTGNRKSFMVLPILGKLIACFGVILSTVFFLKVGVNETALIEGLPPALAGGRVAMTMAVYSYITDITSDSERTFRLGIITAILTLSRPIGLALSGIMTRRFGYYGVFTTACVFYLTGFVYILLRLKGKKSKHKEESQTVLSMFSVKDLVATVNVAFKTRQGSRRLQIILVMFAYMFIVGPVLVFDDIVTCILLKVKEVFTTTLKKMKLLDEVSGENVVNIESSQCEPYKGENNNSDPKINGRLEEFISKTWALRSKVTVEPYIICYMLPSVLAGLAIQNLCLEKSCLVNLKYDQETCRHIMDGRTFNYSEQEKNVQKMVATMTAWSFPLQNALPGILTLFMGSWSDRTGNRKSFMVLPILGKLIACFGVILSTIFFLEVGVNETALIDGILPALAGGRVCMTMAVYSYITDITSDSERTFRLGIITAILTLSRSIGLSLSGIMTRQIGYYGVFPIVGVFYLTGTAYIILRLKVNNKKSIENQEPQKMLSMFSVKDLAATINVAFRTRKGSRRLQIILIMVAYMLSVGPVLGEAQMTYWFTRYKFKFTEVDYSLFLTYSVLVGTIGSFITIYLLSKRWKIEDSIIGMVACVSRIAASLVYAMAPTRTVYFLGPVLDMFSSAGATSLRSIATKLVKSDEVGKASSLISISEALVPVIYSPVYTKVYLSTLSTFSGAFYLISAALAVPAILLYLTLFILHRRDIEESKMNIRQDVKQEVKQEVKHDTNQDSKENEITRF